jgi:cation:H+ antiporter
LLLGLLRREKHGFANIGFESVLVLMLYLGGFSLLFFPS